jgi:hypothetical protein
MYLITHKTANCWNPPNSFQKFKTIVNILIGSLGIWMCQRGQHHQMVPPPPMYFIDSFDIWRGYLSSPPPLLAFPLGIWKAKKKRKTKFYPREYVTSCGCESLLLQYFTSRQFVPSAAHARCHVFFPPPKISPFHPLPPALVPPFVQCRASIRFLRIYIQVPRDCVDNRGIVLERLPWGCNNRLEIVVGISTVERESGNSGRGKKMNAYDWASLQLWGWSVV